MPTLPSINAIHLDLTGWEPFEGHPNKWIKPGPDILNLIYFNVPTKLPCTLNDESCWTSYFEEMIATQNGAAVSINALPIQGLQAVRTIFKFHQPAIGGLSDLGITYLGTWMVPLADFSFNIQVQCYETGTTGMREAAVMLMSDQTNPPKEVPNPEPPRVLESMEEYFDIVRTRPMRRLRADDEEFDAMFPDHPLSRLRGHLSHIANTLVVDDSIRTARPFSRI